MKLLFITSLKEYQKTVSSIVEQAGIHVFSISETAGFKDHQTTNPLDNWFGGQGERFDSIFIFSFTTEVNAGKAIELIKRHNAEHETGFPIRGFVLPVESATY